MRLIEKTEIKKTMVLSFGFGSDQNTIAAMSVIWTLKRTFAISYFCNIHLKHAKNLNVMYSKAEEC